MIENYITDVHDFVEQAPLENIEKYIVELQKAITALRVVKTKNNTYIGDLQTKIISIRAEASPQGAFKKSEFPGQFDR